MIVKLGALIGLEVSSLSLVLLQFESADYVYDLTLELSEVAPSKLRTELGELVGLLTEQFELKIPQGDTKPKVALRLNHSYKIFHREFEVAELTRYGDGRNREESALIYKLE